MEDLYVKPGNKERGWNDPPQFSYSLQNAQSGQRRNILNKRVPPPQLSAQSPSPGCPSPPMASSTPPTKSLSSPTCGTVQPPPSCQKHPSTFGNTTCPQSSSTKTGVDSLSVMSDVEPNIDEVIGSLSWALAACQQTVRKQVCDDIQRRLNLFVEMWNAGKLSAPVKRRMTRLAQELKNKHLDAADEIHRGLMVDFVNEVSQWMVGVKRLIAETRNQTPEQLNAEYGTVTPLT
ncbi:steroid receptor RNA activator 1 [Chanos chanos]|uniref:Steroid receptor RNA activator 1 n=1 Tax=Chanos chanos TaxID=29144 RepID=A0A6J2UNR0_CHACN|nr:steroid receptor RNA activator 1 [Chanos chanos]